MVNIPAEIQALAEQRQSARLAKDWALSDSLRAQLADAGWLVADNAEGFVLTPKPPFEQFATLAVVPDCVDALVAGSVSIDVIVDGWPDDAETFLTALVTHIPAEYRVEVLELGNVDGVGQLVEDFAKSHSAVSITHVAQTLTQVGWASAVTKMLHLNSAASHVVIDLSTVLTGDAITPLVQSLGNGVVAAGWRGVNVNTEDAWRSFVDAPSAGEVDAVLSYLFAIDTEAARATPPHSKAKFYRNADLEWSLTLRAAGGKVVMPTIELPCFQARHHGYHDTEPDFRDRESKRNYDRLLQSFRNKVEILAPRS